MISKMMTPSGITRLAYPEYQLRWSAGLSLKVIIQLDYPEFKFSFSHYFRHILRSLGEFYFHSIFATNIVAHTVKLWVPVGDSLGSLEDSCYVECHIIDN